MARLVVDQKLESLRRCLKRVLDKCPASAAEIEGDPDIQDILVLNLSRAVQLCVDIASHIVSLSEELPPTTMGQAFVSLVKLGVLDETTSEQLQKAVGFRNIAVHAYEEIDWQIVFNICQHQIRDFSAFARQVDDYC